MTSKTIRLNKRDIYDLGGKTYTLKELQEAVIKSSLYDDLKEYIKGGK